eukprot:748196-Hanusia_phi.AAC.4
MGGDLELLNHRNWKPVEAASVPIYRWIDLRVCSRLIVVQICPRDHRAVARPCEQEYSLLVSLASSDSLAVRREYDEIELKAFLEWCGMEEYHHLFVKAGCLPISLKALNANIKHSSEALAARDYLFLLECIQVRALAPSWRSQPCPDAIRAPQGESLRASGEEEEGNGRRARLEQGSAAVR